MYKGSSRGLQRKQVIDNPLPTGGYIGSANDVKDVLPAAETMTLEQVRNEQQQLRTEVLRYETALVAAKIRKNQSEISHIGQQLQVLHKRLSIVNQRSKTINSQTDDSALRQAIKELVPLEMANAIFNRARQLRKERS